MHPHLLESDFRRDELLRLAEQHRVQRNLVKEALAYLEARRAADQPTPDGEEITEVRRTVYTPSNDRRRLAAEG
jgi:hypothetical protein